MSLFLFVVTILVTTFRVHLCDEAAAIVDDLNKWRGELKSRSMFKLMTDTRKDKQFESFVKESCETKIDLSSSFLRISGIPGATKETPKVYETLKKLAAKAPTKNRKLCNTQQPTKMSKLCQAYYLLAYQFFETANAIFRTCGDKKVIAFALYPKKRRYQFDVYTMKMRTLCECINERACKYIPEKGTTVTSRLCVVPETPKTNDMLLRDFNKWRKEQKVNTLVMDKNLVMVARVPGYGRGCIDYRLTFLVRILTSTKNDLTAEGGLYTILKTLNADNKKNYNSCGGNQKCQNFFLLSDGNIEKVGIVYYKCDNAGPKQAIVITFIPKEAELRTDVALLDAWNRARGRLIANSMNKLTVSNYATKKGLFHSLFSHVYFFGSYDSSHQIVSRKGKLEMTEVIKEIEKFSGKLIKIMKSTRTEKIRYCGYACDGYMTLGITWVEKGAVAYYYNPVMKKTFITFILQYRNLQTDYKKTGIVRDAKPNACKCTKGRDCEEKLDEKKKKVISRLCLKRKPAPTKPSADKKRKISAKAAITKKGSPAATEKKSSPAARKRKWSPAFIRYIKEMIPGCSPSLLHVDINLFADKR